MRVRYTGTYTGVMEGHHSWAPGEERDVSDEAGTQLTSGHGPMFERVPDASEPDEPAEEATAPKRRKAATTEES